MDFPIWVALVLDEHFVMDLKTLKGTKNDPQWSRMFLFALVICHQFATGNYGS